MTLDAHTLSGGATNARDTLDPERDVLYVEAGLDSPPLGVDEGTTGSSHRERATLLPVTVE